uniref:Uncharacterized protein n=1 Tax=Rhizophora mucronata TaxID=61149 RepID=A0A2P2QRS8_RHIMU
MLFLCRYQAMVAINKETTTAMQKLTIFFFIFFQNKEGTPPSSL